MKIIFVQLCWIEGLGRFARLAKKRSALPNLGIYYLASVAEKRGHEVEIVDADIDNLTVDDIAKYILQNRFDIVGITATSMIFHNAVRLAKLLKENRSKTKILIGGVHLNIYKKEAFYDCFDYGFFGESEYTFGNFLEIIENGVNDFDSMRGFIYRKDGEVIETPQAQSIMDLDALDFPAMHLMKRDRYVLTFARKYRPKRVMPIVPTRGCPFKCTFCCEPFLQNTIRYRIPENVVDEIEKWNKELGASHFWFMESNMTLKRDRIEGICREIIKRNLKITFEGSTKADLVDRSLLQLMKSAGLIRISYGLESGNPEILKLTRKGVKHEDVTNAVKLSDGLGIETNVSAMIGLPGETKDTINQTIDFIKNTPQILYTAVSIVNPYYGTELHEWALEGRHGLHLLENDYSKYSRYESSPVKVNDLGPEDLVRIQKIALLKIHFTPKRILAAIKMMGFLEMVKIFTNFITVLLKGILKKEKEQRESL